ncbi:MAG: M20 family metallopeptidase [Burkholderiaceae bacterium]|nr:M20 family metallopeptidase [Rhodoferax sp.]MCB2008805.1 M20 family metallopeptidase [Rhodoferax sp.]MCB2029980.1 M20 family metallopeptidase [Rhodoferax sp.]MCP5260345.1 M20 family metallopeptidase [Rhodoferax sp.]
MLDVTTPTAKDSARRQLDASLDAHFASGAFEQSLARRVAWRTESDLGTAPAALADYLREEIALTFAPMGFACTVHDNPDPRGGPFLVARRVEDPRLPTLLTYAHGDVVNGQEGRWQDGLSPWTLTRVDQRWYGRGTADNKGQHSISLAALAQAIDARQGRLGYNVTVLMETGEEAGSPGLHAFCTQQREQLRADLLIACDGPRVSAERPTLFLGARGAVNFTLRVRARDRAFHSGNWGGVLVNPATVLAQAWASMVDRHGRIRVPALRPAQVPADVRDVLAGLPVGGAPDDPTLDPDWGEPGLTPIERLVAWNTLEILAMESGSPARPINAIPSSAVMHAQLRFVVGTPWRDLASIVRAHLDAEGLQQVEVEVVASAAASRTPVSDPWVDWAAQSMARSTGKSIAILPNLAGTLPNDVFSDILGLPTLWVPHSYPACAQHAPNEHLLVDVAREGLQIMGGLFWDLGNTDTAPWPTRA